MASTIMDEINFFAETNYRNQKMKFGIKPADRRRHFYIIGKTGMGKTTLEENMAIQDIQSGRGVGIVDPHGEFAEKMLDYVPSHRVNDVIYFNPADLDYPIAFNVIEKVDPEHRHLVASGLVGVFKKLWAESWGPRLEYVLRNAILTLLEYPGSTLLGILRILADKEYRKKVVEKVSDPVVKSFWVDEFAKYPDRLMAEAVSPIQNKVGQFLTSPLIRNIVGQTKSAINIREAMDTNKILIMNLSKGRIGEDNSALLGNMLVTRLQLAAMSRVDIPEAERKDFYLYVDEFQNFATESFATILSEARKYRLDLILAHQYITQMSEEVRDAVFGNVGSMVTFRVGAYDAEYLEKEFEPEFMINDLVGLGFAQIYLKLMIDGIASRPFSATTLPPITKPEISHRDKIVKISRERYATSRSEVEEKIAKWSGVIEIEKKEKEILGPEISGSHRSEFHPVRNYRTTDGGGKRESEIISNEVHAKNAEPRTIRDGAEPLYDAVCANCGKKIQLKFKPDGVRPVYCQNCLPKMREQGNVNRPMNAPKFSEPAPPQNFSRPPQPRKQISKPPQGEILIKDTGAPVSLGQALKAGPAKFADQKRKKKEVDLAGLRETLSEVLKPEEGNVAEKKVESAPEKPIAPESINTGDAKSKMINPGETIEL